MPETPISYDCGCVYVVTYNGEIVIKNWQHCEKHEKFFKETVEKENSGNAKPEP